MQSRFFHSNPLVGVGPLCRHDIEQRPDLAFGDHVFIVGAAGARARRLPGGILDELADFFLKCHLAKELADPRLKKWGAEGGRTSGALWSWRRARLSNGTLREDKEKKRDGQEKTACAAPACGAAALPRLAEM